MKAVKDKYILMGADIAGFPLKEAVKASLLADGWKVTDLGVQSSEDPNPEMFHRVGFKVGAKISEGEFERGLLFCGTGMGIHIAASKCPHVHAAVVESIHAAVRCVTGNGCNILAMGSKFVTPYVAIEAVKAYLSHELGDGDTRKNFKEFHQLAIDEMETFDYEEYKKNGFEVQNPGHVVMG